MRIIVAGGGIAGIAAALVLSRRGHEVVLLERDQPGPPPLDADEAFTAGDRSGIPQFRQPHNFLGLGRRLLRTHLPDVYRAVLEAGAVEVEQFRFITDGTSEPGDEDLATIACRRPVIDALLDSALRQEPAVDRRYGMRVTGLVVTRGTPPRVRGFVLESGEEITGDLVVDCLGRTTRVPEWLEDAGVGGGPGRSSSECGLVYYSRHFRLRDGAEMPPPASLLGGPRGDLGYAAYALFLGDNRTYSLCIMTPPTDPDLRAVRHPDVFLRIAERLPGVAAWVDPGRAEPITPVLPMGRIHNVLRRYVVGDQPVAPGLQAIGDALCHTNPTFAFGASLALSHVAVLADALGRITDEDSLARSVDAAVAGDATRRFHAVSAEDQDRARVWSGEPLDVTDPKASMALFLRSVVYRTAMSDATVLRAAVRRIDMLDPPDALERNEAVLARARAIYEAMRAAGEIQPGPSRRALLAGLAD